MKMQDKGHEEVLYHSNRSVSEHSFAMYSGDSFIPFFIHVSDTSQRAAAMPLAMYSCWAANVLSEARHRAL